MARPGLSQNALRALDILLIVGDVGPEGVRLAAIAERLGVAKSAAHRSLMALIEKGFVEPAERYGHYRIGPSISMIAKRHERLEPQIQKIRPAMTEFARDTGFTVYLIAPAGEDAVCAEMISRSTRRQFNMGLGARVPMGVGAGSVALLSLMPIETSERIMRANAARYRTHPAMREVNDTIVRQQVQDARERGYAVNMGYYLPGEGGLGVPLAKSGQHQTDLAVSFNAPLEMMNDVWIAKIVESLRECLARTIN